MIGGSGNDIMDGGIGNDTFVFGPNFGADVINGFDANPVGGQDLLDISGLGITAGSFAADVHITGSASTTLITIGASSIVLAGVNVATIDHTDFLLA
jgi:Ca2+-binding RTX toxin-like protein